MQNSDQYNYDCLARETEHGEMANYVHYCRIIFASGVCFVIFSQFYFNSINTVMLSIQK